MGFRDRLVHAWNAFTTNENFDNNYAPGFGAAYSIRPDRTRLRISNEQSIISSIYTRLGIDVASVLFRHIRKDANGRYQSDIDSGLNECLTVEANLDQAATAFRLDMALTLFDEGAIAIVPTDTSIDPNLTGGFDIKTLRVGTITAWHPEHVRVKLYNQKTGQKEELTLPKRFVAIVENPHYSIMNETNSTLQRLIRKLNLLDAVDEASSSGKLDLIIQLPYVIKSEARRQQAEQRAEQIEMQLKGSKYGIAYTDGTEKITQLNRPAENNMLAQIEFLTKMLYGQLGLTESIIDGTADEPTMLNYFNRTIEPILTAFKEAMVRTFLTKTARSQGQTIDFARDPFKLVPISNIAEIADKFTRNEILTSNELRAVIGYRPVNEAKADQLVNSNMPQPTGGDGATQEIESGPTVADMDAIMEDTFDRLTTSADEIIKSAGG